MHPWAMILAGGNGTRLRPLTARLTGDARPKQFCPLLDGETLLDRTRRRVDLLARFDHQVVVVTRVHEAHYRYLAHELAPGGLVVQPENRDTGPAILYGVLRVTDLAGDVPLAIFPSDHWVSNDRAFIEYTRRAVEVVHARPDALVLLGMEASRPEAEYGWIEPAGIRLPIDGEPVFPIHRFREKPSAALARELLARGGLWNTLVMVGWVSAFLGLVEATAPALSAAFESVRLALGSPREAEAVERLYAKVPAMSFSRRVLARAPRGLVTMRVKGVDWTDLGDPRRLLGCLRQTGSEPLWLSGLETSGYRRP